MTALIVTRRNVCGDRHRVLAVLLIALGVIAFGRESPGQGTGYRQAVVLDRDGRKHSGLLKSLQDGSLSIGGAESTKHSLNNLVWLKFADRKALGDAHDPVVVLTDGDRLTLSVESIDDSALHGRWPRFPAFPTARVPLELVRGAILSRPREASADAQLWNLLDNHREPHDLVLLANGDSVPGEFVALDEKRLTLKTGSGPAPIDRSGVLAMAFNPQLLSREADARVKALVSLTDGSRFRVTYLRMPTNDRIEMQTVYGGKLELPLTTIESLRFLGGCAVYLSHVQPAEYKFEPFLALDWPWRADRSVTGGPMRLRGVACPTGLGVHSQSELAYDLDGKFRWFQATVGIDDDTVGKGSVAFEVLVDGVRAYRSEELTGASPAVEIKKIDLTGARRLALRVEFAGEGDILDHADWCDAAIVK
ncbi:MAG: NPCBM/NEW2 domain-containing protein [Planctomycetaceae bacterium]